MKGVGDRREDARVRAAQGEAGQVEAGVMRLALDADRPEFKVQCCQPLAV